MNWAIVRDSGSDIADFPPPPGNGSFPVVVISLFQSEVAKFRFRSTLFAFVRFCVATPSGFNDGITIAVTSVGIINSRHLLYGAVLAEYLEKLSFIKKLLISYFVVDQGFAESNKFFKKNNITLQKVVKDKKRIVSILENYSNKIEYKGGTKKFIREVIKKLPKV